MWKVIDFGLYFLQVIDIYEMTSLSELLMLRRLNLLRNPIQELPDYRLSILYRLQRLMELDHKKVDVEEKVGSLPGLYNCHYRDKGIALGYTLSSARQWVFSLNPDGRIEMFRIFSTWKDCIRMCLLQQITCCHTGLGVTDNDSFPTHSQFTKTGLTWSYRTRCLGKKKSLITTLKICVKTPDEPILRWMPNTCNQVWKGYLASP